MGKMIVKPPRRQDAKRRRSRNLLSALACWRPGGPLLLFCLIAASTHADLLRTIETPSYTIHTDLPDLAAREATIRVTRMAEEYSARTENFAGRIDAKLPFYLYQNVDDYVTAGGPKGTWGVFDGKKLMAVAGEKITALTWQTIQHEGFHQFAQAAISRDLPPWLTEGLAEYFGEAIFTGDGYVDGAIPPWRAKRIKGRIDAGEFRSLRELMNLPRREWNRELALANYDHVWSVVQFLAHGDHDKYQKLFEQFMIDLSSGRDVSRAFEKNLGDIESFELKWKRYWTQLPDDPTREVYAKAITAILNSFLSRAVAQDQTFASFKEFVGAGKNDQIQVPEENWLPPQLLKDGIEAAERLQQKGATFKLVSPSKIGCTLK
jgi:hypothetical protein